MLGDAMDFRKKAILPICLLLAGELFQAFRIWDHLSNNQFTQLRQGEGVSQRD